ncbi:MAG TPA: SNF2-related protein [Chthoniobacterales bacterium]
MNSAAPAITQKLLANAGGWQAMKQAQQLQAAGRVVDANYEPPLLSGTVREGNRNLRSGLRIKSESDVENLCTCRESREWGKICPHAIAVGLAYVASSTEGQRSVVATTRTPPRTDGAAPARNASGPIFVELGSENAIPLAFHFILPPNFESSWAKGQIMIVTEVELGGKRVMPKALAPNERYACDTHDLAALDAFRESFSDGELVAAMRIYPRREFLRVLGGLRGHPRVTFGKTTKVEIGAEAFRPVLRLSQQSHESIRLELASAKNARLLIAEADVWMLESNRFRMLQDGFPETLRGLAEGSITFRGERAQRFLAFEAPRLGDSFELVRSGDWAFPDVATAVPRFVCKIEGTMRELRADLRVRYFDREHRIGAPEPLIIRDPERPGAIFLRNLDAEGAATARLERTGWTRRSESFVLTNEKSIARFFAFEYPRLKTEWEVTLSSGASTAQSELQPLSPRIEVVGSGENWFELRYSLATPDGTAFSAAELQRLLRSGQTTTRLRNGRTAVFDAEAISDFEEVLRDAEPRQNQPGVYRVDRAHSSYIAETAGEIGASLVDPRAALQRLTTAASAQLPALDERLRDYQRDGVSWLWRLAQNNLGGVLADEMGLGKTVQALAFLKAIRATEPALIVCPSSLVTNWRNEAARFAAELRVLVLEGPERHARFAQLGEADLVLTSYALLQRDAEKYRAIQFSTVILDEAQHIKNPDTQNAQTAFALRARHRFVLTGTPIENSVRDLWSIMNFALPGYLGSRADFRERYEQPLARGPAPDVQRRLARRMRPFLLRRRKTEVAKELPEKLEQQVICDLTTPQRAAYDGLLREIQSGLTSSGANAGAQRMKMLVGLLRLRQVCCDLRLLGSELAQRQNESAKLELLNELLEEAIDGGHRVLVFSQFVSMLTLIRERLDAQKIAFSYLDGSTKERQAVVDRFQSDASIPVFLMSLKAGGVGLNLSAADTVIHFDPWWNYAAEAQATDRAHRIGQTRVVTAYKLIARGTVEEKIVKLQARKRSASEATIGSEEPLMSGLTTEDLEELLS